MRSVLLLKGKRGLASWKSPRKAFLKHFNILPLFRQPSLSASDELATHSFSLGMILEEVEGYCKKKSKPLSLEWPGRWVCQVVLSLQLGGVGLGPTENVWFHSVPVQ